MAKKWNEVLANPDYQKLSVSEKSAAREQYFNEVVAPQIVSNEHGAAYQQFTQENPVVTGQAANMGNIRDESGKGFKSYDTPEAGAYDQMRLLTDYSTKHNLNTLSGISGRWAPSNENDTNNYTKTVSSLSGLDANQKLNLSDPQVLGSLSYAQAVMEKGRDNVPFTRDQYIAMAGKRGLYAPLQPQSAPEAPRQTVTPEVNQPQPEQATTPPEAAQTPTGVSSDGTSQSDPYAALKGAMNQQRQSIDVPEWQKDSEALKLSVLGTRDKADLTHPLGYLSPYATINDVNPQTVENAQKTQAMGNDVLKGGAYAAAYAATEGFAAPFMESIGLSPAVAGLTARAAGNTAGSVSSQSTGAIDNPQWQGINFADVGRDVLAGEAIHRVGDFVTPGSATRREAITQSRAADAAREQRISDISDDIAHINKVAPDLHGKSPEQILSDPKLIDSFRKPGETQPIPERLQSTLKGMYGNEQGQVMIDAATSGKPPITNPDWQHTTDAAWKTPISDHEINRATRRLENEFAASERSRPAYTIDELQKLNEAYQSGSGINPNIPLAGTVFNPSIRLGSLSSGMKDRLGMTGAEGFALRTGEGWENSMFGLGQYTRQSNQEALNKAAMQTETNAKTMAGRKVEGSDLAQADLSRLQYQHDLLAEKLKPMIEPYDQAVARQKELTEKLKGDMDYQTYSDLLRELHNTTDEVNSLWPNARDAKTTLFNSQKQINQQVQKVSDQIKLANSYGKAAKTGDSYTSTRDLSNYGANKMAEAETLAKQQKTKGFDESAYHEQQTPRQIQEAKEATTKGANNQQQLKSTPESKLMHWVHFITGGATLIPHLMAAGYSRAIAQSIMRDVERTGGKNLTGDQLRKVMAFMIDNPATIAAANSGDSSDDQRAYELDKQQMIREEEAYQRMVNRK